MSFIVASLYLKKYEECIEYFLLFIKIFKFFIGYIRQVSLFSSKKIVYFTSFFQFYASSFISSPASFRLILDSWIISPTNTSARAGSRKKGPKSEGAPLITVKSVIRGAPFHSYIYFLTGTISSQYSSGSEMKYTPIPGFS